MADNLKDNTFSKEVGKKVSRKLKSRRQANQSIWFGLGMIGLIGWSVIIPTLLGAFLGIWLDNLPPKNNTWTLSLLVLGLTIGCINAWYWVKKEEQSMNEDDLNE